MFRLWAKIYKNNHMLNDMVVSNDDPDMSRTAKIFSAVDEICLAFDLSSPIWLETTVKDFQRHDKTRFYSDNFVDSIDFDYLEIHVIEE